MLKIQKIRSTVKRLSRQLPKRCRRRFINGVQALSLKEFKSLNAAGRKLPVKPNTGMSRIHRLIQDVFLADQLQEYLIKLAFSNKTGRVWLNIDHCQIGNFTVAIMALQTTKGRALPFWFQVNLGRKNAASQPLLAALTTFLFKIKKTYPQASVCLVGDRWFASDALMKLCHKTGIIFLVRTKTDKLVKTAWGRVAISEIANYDTEIEYGGLKMRLVISELKSGMKQPWLLLTNDSGSSRQRLINRYKKRWQIESAFKDAKHSQQIILCRLRKSPHMRNLLLFIFLGWHLLWQSVAKRALLANLKQTHPKKALSWFNYLFEQLPVCYLDTG